jgi:hypothetical protein
MNVKKRRVKKKKTSGRFQPPTCLDYMVIHNPRGHRGWDEFVTQENV